MVVQCLGLGFREMSRARSEYFRIITTYMVLNTQQWMKFLRDEKRKKDIANNNIGGSLCKKELENKKKTVRIYQQRKSIIQLTHMTCFSLKVSYYS